MTAFKGLGTYGDGVGVVTPSDHKQDNSGLLVKASGNTVRPGLFWGGTPTIVLGKANMSYDVAAYTCATSRGATSGTVFGGNDGTYNVATTAAPGSNSRYDVVYHWQREVSIDGTDSNPVIGVIQGTAAASPTVPSLAAFPGAIALATILVPAGVTATNTGTTITQTAPFTAAAGGIVPIRNDTEETAFTAAAGQLEYRIDTDTVKCFDGTNWNSVSGGKLAKPSTVAVTGTSPAYTVSAGGRIDFTNCTQVKINSVFLASLSERFKVAGSFRAVSTATTVTAQMVNGTTVDSASNYDLTGTANTGGANSNLGSLSATLWPISNTFAVLEAEWAAEVRHPNDAVKKTKLYKSSFGGVITFGASFGNVEAHGDYKIAAVHDGIVFNFSNLTNGSIWIVPEAQG